MSVVKPFNGYKLIHYAGTFKSTPDNPVPQKSAALILYQDSTLVAIITFIRDGEYIAPPAVGSYMTIQFPERRITEIVDTLRYEKPLHVCVNSDYGYAYIGTVEQEPVGESESLP